MAFKSLSRFIEACSVGRSKPHSSWQTLLHISPSSSFSFSFCCQHMTQSGLTHTQHRRLFPFCCSVSQIPESFLRLGFWQTTEIMVSLCRDANAAARQSQQRRSQRCVNHRCCGRSRGFLVDFEGQLTPSSFVLHLRYLALICGHPRVTQLVPGSL